MNTDIISIVVGALGTTLKSLEKNLKRAETTGSMELLLQKAVLLHNSLLIT